MKGKILLDGGGDAGGFGRRGPALPPDKRAGDLRPRR